MANEFRHKNVVAGRITENEYENINQHEAEGQTANDMLYFNGSYWIRATPQTIRDTVGLSQIVGKNLSERALDDFNRTTTLAFTDLDLTAYTSANAKFAILLLIIAIDSITAGVANYARIGVRKKGADPATYFPMTIIDGVSGAASSYRREQVIVELDAGQVCEYELTAGGTVQFDSHIEVLGYIE